MTSKIRQQEKKRFFVKSYEHLWQLEEAINAIQQHTQMRLDVSVLGKVSDRCISSDKKILASKKELKTYWRGSLGPKTGLGLFCNPDIGSLFIAGPLVSQFLHDLDGKVLGEMPSGPYGILRGLGISAKEAASFLKVLNEEYFLLLARGNSNQLKQLSGQLKKNEVPE